MMYYTRKLLVVFSLFFVAGQTVFGQSIQLQNQVKQIWFNVLANKLGLDTGQFQLYPGSAAVGNTSDWMWQIFDAIPGKTTDHYYNPQQFNSFSADYGLILCSMKAGDVNYMLNNAIMMYASANHKYVWNKTIANLKNALATGTSMQLDTAITITYVPDSTSGTKSQVAVNIKAQFNKYTIFYASPYAKADSLNQGLKPYQPWFSWPMFSQAYNISNNTVWLPNQNPTWQTVFGWAGFMQNVCIALVAADGVNVTISFNVPGSQSVNTNNDSTAIKYAPIVTTGSTNSSYVNSNGDFIYTITYTSMPGNQLLLGVLVCSMAAFVNNRLH